MFNIPKPPPPPVLPPPAPPVKVLGKTYQWHHNIMATMFWVGEGATEENAYISNVPSAWNANWQAAFGGVDSPNERNGSYPKAFTPKENPFYFALPFNDHLDDGSLKPISRLSKIPWYTGPPASGSSLVKNRWIEVKYKAKTVYAQWEDVGPLETDDVDYVFGKSSPKYSPSGLDLSPAANDYLGLAGEGKVSWRFLDAYQVPKGPWKSIVTTSGIRN